MRLETKGPRPLQGASVPVPMAVWMPLHRTSHPPTSRWPGASTDCQNHGGQAPRNAEGTACTPWVPVLEHEVPETNSGSMHKNPKRQEDSVSADSFRRKISEAKGTHGNIVIGKRIFLKNFYKWKLLQVQAIFKNTTTWVAGRRGTAVFKYFSEGVSIRPHSAVCPEGPAWLCGSHVRLDHTRQPLLRTL